MCALLYYYDPTLSLEHPSEHPLSTFRSQNLSALKMKNMSFVLALAKYFFRIVSDKMALLSAKQSREIFLYIINIKPGFAVKNGYISI